MSNEGFQGIPGVPDGWELIHANRCAEIGEYGIDEVGRPFKFKHSTVFKSPIIRKIEVPKKYRPFANAEEFKPHRDRWVKIVSEDNNCGCQLEDSVGDELSIHGCDEHSVCVWEGWMTYGDAFKCFVFDDGTPFGVEVTSE
jgi:hypothetical protein